MTLSKARQVASVASNLIFVSDFSDSANDTAAISAAILAATFNGGGRVVHDARTYDISSKIALTDTSGVVLVGQGCGYGFMTTTPEDTASTLYSWSGGADAMVHFSTTQTALRKMVSSGVNDIAFDGGGVATIGIYATTLAASNLVNVSVIDTVSDGILMDCLDNKTNSGAGDASDNQGNRFENIFIKTASGNCIRLDGNLGLASTVGANSSMNTFKNIHLNIVNNDGFVFDYSDTNELDSLRVIRTGTGRGLIFEADNDGDNKHARSNTCVNVQTADSGIFALAGDSTQPSEDNLILGYNYGNNGVDNPPTIEAGATLGYITPRLLKNIGASQFICTRATTEVGAASNIKAQALLMGTESLRIHSTGSNHIKLVNDSGDEWGVSIDAATGNLRFLRASGTGDIKLSNNVSIKGLVGFYDTSPVAKQTVTGSAAGNAALVSLLTALETLGLITDSST